MDDNPLQGVLPKIRLKDNVERVGNQRKQALERLRRLAYTYLKGLCDDTKYDRQKRLMEMELDFLVVTEVDATEEAGHIPDPGFGRFVQHESRRIWRAL